MRCEQVAETVEAHLIKREEEVHNLTVAVGILNHCRVLEARFSLHIREGWSRSRYHYADDVRVP